ncbi:MAG: hypothetical protein ACO1OY_08400 [Ramlibacter sp.]
MMPDTLPPTSRRNTQPGSSHGFGGLSDFLRTAIADEEAQQFSDGMRALLEQAEPVVAALQASRSRLGMAPLLMDLLTALRAHHAQVQALGPAWHGFYEYAGYLQSLNQWRTLVGESLRPAAAWDDELPLTADDLRQAAWRTLGDGMLLLELYEQWLKP